MSEIFEALVRKRGFSESFLNPKYEELASPWLLPDMREAIERLKRAKERGEKIIVYGDYDADGVTASTVMNEILGHLGLREVETMLPDRFADGYGMSKKVVQRVKETGATLVITVDCGSGNGEIVRELSENGVETIVTDHHETPEKLPEAVAVVNPKRRDVQNTVPDFEEHLDTLMNLRDLAGVGVAFMVARACVEEGLIPEGQEKWLLDLVLIGTICDSMKITEENRRLCYFGTKVLAKTRRPGLKELLRTSGTGKITAEAIGFQLGPRLNAAGRMANARVAFDLLNTKERAEAAKLAGELETLNSARRAQQMEAVKAFQEKGVPEDEVLVLAGDFHEGVLGIIAGRIVEEYKRPAFILAEKDGILKGSGRSFGDFNLADALKACKGEIIGGGGHAGAAGVKIEAGRLEEFRGKINEYYRSLGLEEQERFFEKQADLEMSKVGGLNLELLRELEQLEPFGAGNEVPIFGLERVFILDKKMLGPEEKHLRLLVRGEDGRTLKMMAFSAPREWRRIEQGREANILINLEENEWNGLRSAEGRILDLRGC